MPVSQRGRIEEGGISRRQVRGRETGSREAGEYRYKRQVRAERHR